MSEVRRTLWERLQGKQIDYYVPQPVNGLPEVETRDGLRVQPMEMSVFAVGERVARISLSGPVRGERFRSTVSFDGWEELPEDVAAALSAQIESRA